MELNFEKRVSPLPRREFALHDDSWSAALRRAVQSGVVAAGTTAVCAALAGVRDSGSAVAPLNATSHIAWGESAARAESIDASHTLLGVMLHAGACVFWATFYEKYFGRVVERGEVGTAAVGGAVVAAAAYVTDYHIVPKRLTPGWEYRVSGRSLAAIYTVLALSLPLRALLRRHQRVATLRPNALRRKLRALPTQRLGDDRPHDTSYPSP